MSGFGNNSHRQSSNRHGGRHPTESRLPSEQTGASRGGTLGAFDCGGGAPRQSISGQNVPPSGGFPRSSARSQAFPPGASGQRSGTGSGAAQSRSGGTMQRHSAGSNAAQSHSGGTMQRYGASQGAVQTGWDGMHVAGTAHPRVHFTRYTWMAGDGWDWHICCCRDPASHGDAYSYPDDPSLSRDVFRDSRGTYMSMNQLLELEMQAAGQDMITKDDFEYEILPLIAHRSTIAAWMISQEEKRILSWEPFAAESAALPADAIWYSQVNPRGYKLVPSDEIH